MVVFVIVLIVGFTIMVFNLLLVAYERRQATLAEFSDRFGSPNSDTAKQAFLDTFGVAWNDPRAAYAVKQYIHEMPSGVDKMREIILAQGYGYLTAYWY